MRRVGIRTALVVIVALTLSVDVARAQDGVFIDPGSPSGKEYEIPLETVRRGAQPGTDPSAPITQGERSAAPFGEGITGETRDDEDSSGAGSAAGSDGGRKSGGADGSGARERGDDAAGSPSTSAIVEAAASNPGAPPSSTGSTLLYVGAGALVLALGAGAGVLMRRRRT